MSATSEVTQNGLMPNQPQPATPDNPRQPSALDDFMFDLNGYLILRNTVDADLLARLNAEYDQFPRDLEHGDWYKGAQRRDYNKFTGLELHSCVEMGGPFEELIDHPSWINYLRHYCGEEKSYVEGLFIDECIASVRSSGGHHPVHSGGYQGALRGRYLYEHGMFRCGQVNIILALTDIHEGDGPTMVIPGSHKSNFPHPECLNQGEDYNAGKRMDTLEGAIPAYMNKGDALLFVDGLMHGGSSRTNEGERRITIYRYGPVWGASRFGYVYSDELLNRLTPERRKILQPVPPCTPQNSFVPREN
jgi:ectoine hydroxylase-related dioxygenase (phytanoyl-CoA dioxygenase family)